VPRLRRIALVSDWYPPRRGGIESHLEQLATRLRDRGHDVHVITSTRGPASLEPGITIHRLDVRRLPAFGVAMEPVAGRITEIVEREKIEVVHAHVSIVSPVAAGGGLAAHRTRTPCVLTFHSFVPATPLWASLAGRALGTSAWKARMTAVSSRVAREVRAFAPQSPMTILPNAIDTAFWMPSPGTVDRRDRITLVFAGRLQAKKRPLLLLDVLRELHRRAPQAPWHLRIVGTGPLEPALRRVIVREGLAGRVTLDAWSDRTALREALRSSDVFLSTARRESFGLAALEARAVGLPVVAMGDSGVADFIRDGESGLLAADDAAFVQAVRRLVLDDALRDRITAHNRATPPGFGWAEAMELHEAAYAAAADALRGDG
jgi:glycosyltransferase involved in cell wall biosynthesis